MSAAKDQEYFSDGLTEEILNQLAQIKALRVTGRTSSFSFKGKNEDLRAIGDKLGVAHLLEGSIRKDGNQLRITAQLINAADGAHLWSRTYDRELTKVFLLQEEIAKDVSKALSITLDVSDLPRAQGGTTNVEAYDKYLRGKQLVLQEGRSAYIQGAQFFREAVALDPGFTLAWMWLADALSLQIERDPDDLAAVTAELATARARVLQLAPQSGLARQVRASDYMLRRKWLDAEAALQLSDESTLSTGPQSVYESARVNFLVTVGRIGELRQLTERASKRDPLSLAASTTLQTVLDLSGRPADAQAEYERSKALQGDHGRANHFALVRLLRQENVDQSQVRAQFDVFLNSEPLPMKASAVLRDRFDRPEAAREAVREALQDPENEHPIRMFIIALYADAYGDRETAMRAILRATELSSGVPTTFFGWYPYKTVLRTDPRFKQMVREMGLVDYWRASGNWADYCKPVGTDDFECK
jgi:TolB-like protein